MKRHFKKIKTTFIGGMVLALLSQTSLAANELTDDELNFEPTVETLLDVERLETGHLDIMWDSLIPKGWVEPMPEPIDWSIPEEELTQLMSTTPGFSQTQGPTVSELNGEKIRIPGFILPLEASDKGIKEFLFVPYVGACMHVPPPPTNQLIYAVSEEYITDLNMWQPVFLFGTLSTEEVKNDIGNSSYLLNIEKIEEYREE